MFPFRDVNRGVESSELEAGCSTRESEAAWCPTKLNTNRSMLRVNLGYWGYCSPNCSGTQFHPAAPENQAGTGAEVQEWEEDVYDLRTWESGHCHTYSPAQSRPTGSDFRLSLFLGNRQVVVGLLAHSDNHISRNPQTGSCLSYACRSLTDELQLQKNFASFYLYIHEKGQFWPRPHMESYTK